MEDCAGMHEAVATALTQTAVCIPSLLQVQEAESQLASEIASVEPTHLEAKPRGQCALM
jgi:hypothetical protein